jgi:hypothetical protein
VRGKNLRHARPEPMTWGAGNRGAREKFVARRTLREAVRGDAGKVWRVMIGKKDSVDW